MILLNLLKGATVFMSVASFVVLTAAMIELWVQRHEDKDPDYKVAITVLKWLSVIGWVVSAILAGNYAYRFYVGLAGSLQPGPEATAVVSLLSFVACYSFFTLVGAVLLYILWMSDEPTEEEEDRRRRIARVKLEAERRRRTRRLSGRARRGT